MRKQIYSIETAGQDAEILRATAKVAQARVRTLHAAGIPAQLRRLKNAAEKRAALETLAA